MELTFSSSDARRVCRKDAERLGIPETNDFVTFNAAQTRLLCLSWLAVCQDCGVRELTLDSIKSNLVYAGLIPVVEAAGEIADLLLEGLHQEAGFAKLWEGLFEDRTYKLPWFRAAEEIFIAHPSYTEATKYMLQAFCYPERFTYNTNNLRVNFSLSKFRDVNRACKQYTFSWTQWPGQCVLDALRCEFRDIMEPQLWHYDISDAKFSSGSCAGGANTLILKLRALATYVASAYHHPLTALPGGKNMGVKGKKKNELYPTLIEVPKKLLSRRVIAPERVDVAFYAQAALAALRRVVEVTAPQYINEHDQSINNQLAAEGSLTGEWATIDMSSASDSITRDLFFAVLPQELHGLYKNFTSKYCLAPDGNYMKLWMLFTSGNPLTWLTEACWFLAIGRLGTRLAGVSDYKQKVFAFGDDLIVPATAYDTVCELLELLGHSVNRRKSYGSGVFRESCGGWYCRGIDVTPLFWPRRGVTDSKPDLIRAASNLQHKAVENNFPCLDYVCRNALRELEPRMSVSYPGSEYDDIWDPLVSHFDSDRAKHIRVTNVKQAVTKTEPLYEHYVYYQYLICGPLYMSELDELLGISTSRRQVSDAYVKDTELRVTFH